jgi:4'-phosphopantetheinyl transferase
VLPPDPSWPHPTGPVALAAGEVHVWRVDLSLTHEEEVRRTASLAADERQRAARFLSSPARAQFVAARSALRAILGRYTGQPAGEIEFRLGPVGKPGLADPGPALFFNLSHSRDLALVALTRSAEVGVDVEHARLRETADQLAERFFHPNEVAALRALPPDQRTAGFFNAWTRKEAFLKATGKGISYGIERVEVALTPGERARVLSVNGDRGAAGRWSLEALAPASGYVGAVAMQGEWDRVVCYSFAPQG